RVLDGVVTFDLDVALGPHRQVEARVGAQRGKHVIEERHTGLNVDIAGAVEIELDDDVRLFGLAFDLRDTRCGHCAPMDMSSVATRRALTSSSASFSSARPVVARRYPGMPTSRMRTPASR